MFKQSVRVFVGVTATLLAACGGGNDGAQSRTPDPSTPPTIAGCPALPPSTATPGSLGAIVDALVATEIQSKGLPSMTVAVARDTALLHFRGYGYANTASCLPVEATTEYQIGSVTKQFTAAAILQLQEAGYLDLDSTAVSHLPSFMLDARITVRMLLNQTSGLADYVEFPEAVAWIPGVAQATVLNAIAQSPLRFTPGSAYEYSNSNYFILGSIIEVVSGMTYEQYVLSRIVEPSLLSNTSFLEPLTAARPYTYSNPNAPSTSALVPGTIPHHSGFFAAGALWSNVQDLILWNLSIRKSQLITSSQFELMVTPSSVPIHQEPATPSPYAMGWVRTTLLGRPFVWHNGKTLAYTAFNGMFLDNGFAVAILTNVDMQDGTPLWPFAENLIRSICTSSETAGEC